MAESRAHLFLGPEIGEKQDALQDLRTRLRDAVRGGALEETSFYAGETSAAAMSGVILNGSLFADARLFIIKNAETLKKNDAELIASCMGSLRDGTVLALLSDDTKIDARLEKAAGPKNKRIFWEMFDDRKAEWVRNFFRREGFRISNEGAETVLEFVENNTDALRRECSRLCLFMDKNRTIEADDVDKWLAHSREESAFTLFSRIASGDLSRSIETLHTLLASKESPQALFAGLVWCYRRFRDYLEVTAAGPADDAAFRRAGFTSPRARKDYAALARRLESAGGSLALITEFDLLLRQTGSQAEGFLLDLLVYKLVTGAERPREKWSRY
ncbi:MAG: DNA polymerase III subunit delta [Spirochaetaceae bacterium]|jgi:DNA polymerase-3 subunit delta|nr:DNA polymerase III subunit delta [Spirochaetaceae bacterium]